VPTLKDIGLFGERVRKAFADMDVLGYAGVDLDTVMGSDERAACEIDAARRQQVAETIALATA